MLKNYYPLVSFLIALLIAQGAKPFIMLLKTGEFRLKYLIASGGYPLSYEKGKVIEGLDAFTGKEGYYCFHAGTKFDENGQVVTSGGRVLGITALGENLKEARARAYEAAEWIRFDGQYMRHDIGKAIDDAEA